MGYEVSAIFLSPGDKRTEKRNLRAWVRLRAVTMRYADIQAMAEFHYVYTRRIRVATPPLNCTSSRGSYLTHCGRVTQICVFNTVKIGTSASSPWCHSTRGNVSRGITPSSTTRVFGEYYLKISVHKNSSRICYKFLKKHSIKVD